MNTSIWEKKQKMKDKTINEKNAYIVANKKEKKNKHFLVRHTLSSNLFLNKHLLNF
jgi:hypothetical protein